MTDENVANDQTVDVNTDDLEEFTNLFHGKAVEKVEDNPSEEVEKDEDEIVEDTDATETDQEPEAEAEDETDESEPEVDVKDPDEDDSLFKAKPKNKKSFQERINELTAKAREAERREQEALRRIQDLEAKGEIQPKEQKIVRSNDDDIPNPDELNEDGSLKYPLGEFDPHFIRDITRATIERENKAFREAQAKAAEEDKFNQVRQKLESDWSQNLSEVEKDIPDIREEIASMEDLFRGIDPNYGQYLAATVMSMKAGPQVLYYLSQNPEKALEIVNSGPTAATLSLGKLEARIEAAIRKEEKGVVEKKVTAVVQAPAPRVKGAGGRSPIRADTDDLDAFADMFFKKK